MACGLEEAIGYHLSDVCIIRFDIYKTQTRLETFIFRLREQFRRDPWVRHLGDPELYYMPDQIIDKDEENKTCEANNCNCFIDQVDTMHIEPD